VTPPGGGGGAGGGGGTTKYPSVASVAAIIDSKEVAGSDAATISLIGQPLAGRFSGVSILPSNAVSLDVTKFAGSTMDRNFTLDPKTGKIDVTVSQLLAGISSKSDISIQSLINYFGDTIVIEGTLNGAAGYADKSVKLTISLQATGSSLIYEYFSSVIKSGKTVSLTVAPSFYTTTLYSEKADGVALVSSLSSSIGRFPTKVKFAGQSAVEYDGSDLNGYYREISDKLTLEVNSIKGTSKTKTQITFEDLKGIAADAYETGDPVPYSVSFN
jgi:hypothetical protein